MKKRRLSLDKEVLMTVDPIVDGGRLTMVHPTCYWVSVTLQLSQWVCDDVTLSGCLTDGCGSAECEPDMSDGAACGDTITCQPYSAC